MTRCLALLALLLGAACGKRSKDDYKKLSGIMREAAASAPSAADKYRQKAEDALLKTARSRLTELLEDTTTDECRELVTKTFIDTYDRALREDYLPFEQVGYMSDCRPDQPSQPRPSPKAADDIRICYLLIVHENPQQITRLIEALEEGERHSFVVHVDNKPNSEATFQALLSYADSRPHVKVMTRGRQSVSWGGFNVVQATLNGMEVALDDFADQWDWVWTLSGYTYPLASNAEIRQTLARHPADTEFLEIRPSPNEPMPRAWHQFVECDGRMRRIWRLLPPRRISMYMGSQWMVVTKAFANYAVGRTTNARGQSFAKQYRPYATHTMVADENFFTTVLKNSPMCGKHENNNFLHVQFDQWENEKHLGPSANKCLQPNPKHCGRSPTTLTSDYLPVLELGRSLFARKFDVKTDAGILDAIDAKRKVSAGPSYQRPEEQYFENIRIARPAPNGVSWCVAVEEQRGRDGSHRASLKVCDRNDAAQKFMLGPCSSDGHIALGAPAKVTPGAHAPAPFCPISMHHGPGARHPICLDLSGENITPGTAVIGWGCSGRWNQLWGLGTGAAGAPAPGSVFINIPYDKQPVRNLCLDAPQRANAQGKDAALRVEKCTGSYTQTFHVEPWTDPVLTQPPRGAEL